MISQDGMKKVTPHSKYAYVSSLRYISGLKLESARVSKRHIIDRDVVQYLRCFPAKVAWHQQDVICWATAPQDLLSATTTTWSTRVTCCIWQEKWLNRQYEHWVIFFTMLLWVSLESILQDIGFPPGRGTCMRAPHFYMFQKRENHIAI